MSFQPQAIPGKSEHGYVAPDYLAATARIAAANKAQSYAQMQITPGQRVLDVGCGIGVDVLALAQLVGAHGQACGVDADAEMVQQASATISGGRITQASATHASASALPWPNDYFDATRSERMLQHLAQPEIALTEMVRVTRPGGRVVLLDTDWGSLSIHAPNAELERRLVAFKAEQALRNGFVGRQLVALARNAGLRELHIEVLPMFATDYATARFACALDDLSARAQQAGVASAEEIDDFAESLAALDHVGDFFASVNMVLVAGSKV
jgi:ubiquinone/menaquinone biosynthesis C-methylase UbiE